MTNFLLTHLVPTRYKKFNFAKRLVRTCKRVIPRGVIRKLFHFEIPHARQSKFNCDSRSPVNYRNGSFYEAKTTSSCANGQFIIANYSLRLFEQTNRTLTTCQWRHARCFL